jgi:hypothetical protein
MRKTLTLERADLQSSHGKKTVNTVPKQCPACRDFTLSDPRCRSMISRLIHSPKPVPLLPFVVKKGSNMWDIVSTEIPEPVFGDCTKGDDCYFAIDSMVVEFQGSGNGADGLPNPTRVDAWAYGFNATGRFLAILGRKYGCLEVLAITKHDLGAVQP